MDGTAGVPGARAQGGGDVGAVPASKQGEDQVAAGGEGLGGGGAGADLQIVCLGNGSYRRGEECYFPSDGAEEEDGVLPQVDFGVITTSIVTVE